MTLLLPVQTSLGLFLLPHTSRARRRALFGGGCYHCKIQTDTMTTSVIVKSLSARIRGIQSNMFTKSTLVRTPTRLQRLPGLSRDHIFWELLCLRRCPNKDTAAELGSVAQAGTHCAFLFVGVWCVEHITMVRFIGNHAGVSMMSRYRLWFSAAALF